MKHFEVMQLMLVAFCDSERILGSPWRVKPLKRVAVENLVFQPLVGQIVQRLQNENFEHQNSVKADRTGI